MTTGADFRGVLGVRIIRALSWLRLPLGKESRRTMWIDQCVIMVMV